MKSLLIALAGLLSLVHPLVAQVDWEDSAFSSPQGVRAFERHMDLSSGAFHRQWEGLDLDHIDSLAPFSTGSIAEALQELARSDRVELLNFGLSYEGHPITAAIISSPRRMEDMEALRHSIRLEAYGEKRPLVIWIGATIHGNESSGAEGALALIEHFANSSYEDVAHVLDTCVLVINPLQNPDGRSRFLSDLSRWNGLRSSLDRQSLAYRASWPSGRGNHYFMDLNRDWANLSQAESWGKVKLFLEYPPQVTFDLHEMSGQEGYLFSPPRAPFHPNVPASTKHWWDVISTRMAKAFGEEGWSCTTQDWHEEFNPNRGAAWPLHMGAVSFLGEQFNTQGSEMMLPHGATIDYLEAVKHQYLAALNLIEASANHRDGILEDYARNRGSAFEKNKKSPAAYLIALDESPEQGLRLARILTWMGLELEVAQDDFRIDKARNYYGEDRGKKAFSSGSLLLNLAQVQGPLARAQMDFDTQLSEAFLAAERASIERGEESLVYETTAWSLAQAHGASVYELDAWPSVSTDDFNPKAQDRGSIKNPAASFAFVLDANSPGFAKGIAMLHEHEVPCWAAGMPFVADGVSFDAGSVVIKRHDSQNPLDELLASIARTSSCTFYGLNHALTEEGPDLGASSFQRLSRPRIALLSGSPFYQTSFGALWHLFDQEVGYPISLIKLSQLEGIDLGRYNVLILPDAGSGRGEGLAMQMGDVAFAKLMAWVNGGGSLITLGESNWLLFSGDEPISSLRARRQVLDDLGSYLDDGRPGSVEFPILSDDEDAWLRRFSPEGAILRADLESDHWIAGGVGDKVPVMVRSDLALLGKAPGEILGQFNDSENLRLSGLLWPEAEERLRGSAYLYREAKGRGQLIAFMGNPAYRAAFHGTSRLLLNAVFLGPGMGARQPSPW